MNRDLSPRVAYSIQDCHKTAWQRMPSGVKTKNLNDRNQEILSRLSVRVPVEWITDNPCR
jgi:hypothetical protein